MFNLLHYKNAAFPCLAVETCEEERFLRNVLSIKDTPVYSVSALSALKDCRTGEVIDKQCPFQKAFTYVASLSGAILLAYDLQHIIKNPAIYRALKECFAELKHRGSMIVMIAPAWALPAELSHDIPILQFDLPTREQLARALDVVANNAEVPVKSNVRESLLDAAAGLAAQEAENAFALSLVKDRDLIPSTVEAEKMRLVKSSGLLEVSTPVAPESIGGMTGLKAYIRSKVIPSMHNAKKRVKGILLVGVPGTGKSLAARVLGSLLQYPICRMDVGSLKGGIVGQSESNMRSALKMVDAVSPCILWMDEIEKGVGGHASSAQSDGGTTLGMIGQLLTWLQEHETPVIVIATCNDYAKLPAELTRAGRFDERFFVDLPNVSERAEIASIHIKYYTGSDQPEMAAHIASITDQWTGAEIQQLVLEAARESDTLTDALVGREARNIKPISRVKADEISKLREWAKDCLRMAGAEVESRSSLESGRKVSVI